MQAALMLIIAVICFVSAGLWLVDYQINSALAFAGFGIGYIGLAMLFWGVP